MGGTVGVEGLRFDVTETGVLSQNSQGSYTVG